jgi:hypothetical protein
MHGINIPLQLDHFVGWPLVIVIALAINLLTACWAHAKVRTVHNDATNRGLFKELTYLSVLSAVAGILAANEFANIVIIIVALAALFYFIASTMKFTVNKLYWLIAGSITTASFLIGEVIIRGNSLVAAALIFCGIIASLIIGMMIGVANSYGLGDKKP